MPHDTDRKMTDDEWWDGFDRELSQLFAGNRHVHAARLILSAVLVCTALLVYMNH